MEETAELARSLTNGQGADSAIVCVGVTTPEQVAAGGPRHPPGRHLRPGRVGMNRMADHKGIPVSVQEVVLYQKWFQGSPFGASSPARDIPAMVGLYRQSRLKLDEIITTRGDQ